jgi:hypothetical protein
MTGITYTVFVRTGYTWRRIGSGMTHHDAHLLAESAMADGYPTDVQPDTLDMMTRTDSYGLPIDETNR